MKLPAHELGDLYKLGIAAFRKKRRPPPSKPMVKRPSQPKQPETSKEITFNADKLRRVHGRCAAAAFAMADRGNAWDKLFRTLDRNHDKKLDQAEFVLACREVLDLSEDTFPDDIVESVFSLLDQDGGGEIDVQVCHVNRTATLYFRWLNSAKGKALMRDCESVRLLAGARVVLEAPCARARRSLQAWHHRVQGEAQAAAI